MVEIIGHTKDKEKQRLKRDNYMEGQLMEKAICYIARSTATDHREDWTSYAHKRT